MAFKLTYLEDVDDVSPGSAGCSVESAHASIPYLLSAPSANDLQTAITEILGTVDTSTGDGRLKRTLPMAHPVFPYWYASSIGNIKGYGNPTKTNAQPKLECASVAQFALYKQYKLDVEFTPRPYAVLADKSISLKKSQTWYDTDGTTKTNTFVGEWNRFTDFEPHPQNDNITAQQGTMIFHTASNTSPGGATPSASVQFSGMPRLFLPNQLIQFTWYQVPYRYISSSKSWIATMMGKVNQNDWYQWDAGELLYLNYKPKRYTPPVQAENLWIPGAFSTEKLCNIEFTFLGTSRTGSDVPVGDLAAKPALQTANHNWVAAGHNLLPWLKTRKFYYADFPDSTAANRVPTWLSFPFELLFTDPDL